ncbi:MAG: dienelactone hydrolase family protein [Pirellulales bacterium]|nr:dienelactone hydrolase family protein [Pirellulales bacterium]
MTDRFNHSLFSPAQTMVRRARGPLVKLGFLITLGFLIPPDGAPTTVHGDDVVPLPGTAPLTGATDLALANLQAVDSYLLKLIQQSPVTRTTHWHRQYASLAAYRDSVAPNRQRLARAIGAVDPRTAPQDLQLYGSLQEPGLIADSDQVRIWAVRWTVFADVSMEGLLLEPRQPPRAEIVAVADADTTPETFAGLEHPQHGHFGIALQLAQRGCRVLIPRLVNRDHRWSGNPRVRMLRQSHREFIYRQAFVAGRHLIGLEVQSLLAAVDYFEHANGQRTQPLPIGCLGIGEGGLLALYAAALDPRIQGTLASGYFQPRERVFEETVDRNIYGQLREFGDAEIASLIAPRSLVIEACRGPEVTQGQGDAARGTLRTPSLDEVRAEFSKAADYYRQLQRGDQLALIASDNGAGPAGSTAALDHFLKRLGISQALPRKPGPLRDHRRDYDSQARQRQMFRQWVTHVQTHLRQSRFRRRAFWSAADATSIKQWRQSTTRYRKLLWDEVIGRLPPASLPPAAHTRRIYQNDRWDGFEVKLDVYPGVFACGVLLLPHAIPPGERRPVVVIQHGRGGRPQDICSPGQDSAPYHSLGARLADRGYIVFAPQNLYLGEEKYRALQRKAFALGMTFFAPMVRQHEQILKWLSGLPAVDAQRIGFYGLSYGGKSAMLIPAVLPGYALSICSGDFNEEVWKHTSIDDGFSFMFTLEHEHTEFDFADRFNYAEIAWLIAPRPFMVERGHHDGVGLDEWVAYEYARVRRRYVELGLADRTRIEFFDGHHEIHAVGTIEFLDAHLRATPPPPP